MYADTEIYQSQNPPNDYHPITYSEVFATPCQRQVCIFFPLRWHQVPYGCVGRLRPAATQDVWSIFVTLFSLAGGEAASPMMRGPGHWTGA